MTRLRIALAVSAAWVGVVAGHTIAYALAYDDVLREAHLESTGHGSFPLLVISAAVVVPMALVLAAISAVRGGRPLPRRRTALLLATLQVPAFLTLELIERGGDVAHTLGDPAVLAGVLVQIVVAIASAWTLGAFVRGVRAIVERLRSAPRETSSVPPRLARIAHRSALTFLVRARRRAPPLLVD